MDNVYVRPCLIEGQPASLPDPQTGFLLAAAGEWKPRTAFWLRRIAQGDVIECVPEIAAAPADPAPAVEDRAPLPPPKAKPPVEARAPRPAKS